MSTWGLHSAANKLYENLFPIYRPLYSAYKTCTDRAERELLRKILFPGAVVVDVGANIGIYSKFLSRCVGPTGLVHSFEPSADNFRRLRAATRKLSNVRLSQAAVGERSGESKLYVSNRLNVDHRMYKTDGDSHRPVRAEMVALDDYFKPGQRVDLIKMDIQGYELHALRGANRVVQENPDIKLLFEFWPHGLKQAGASSIELIDALQTKNMSVFQITTRGVVPFRSEFVSEAPDCYMNLFASSE